MIPTCDHPHTNRGDHCHPCLDAMTNEQRHFVHLVFEAKQQGLPVVAKNPFEQVLKPKAVQAAMFDRSGAEAL